MKRYGAVDEVATHFVMGLDGCYSTKSNGFSWANDDRFGVKYRVASSWRDCAYALDTWNGSKLVIIESDDVWRRFSSHRRAIAHAANTSNTRVVETSVRLLSLILSNRVGRFPVEMLRSIDNVTSDGGYWSFNLAGCSWVGGEYWEKGQKYYWAAECPGDIQHWSHGLISLIPRYCRKMYRDLDNTERAEYAEYLLKCMGKDVLYHKKYFVAKHTLDRMWSRIKEQPDVDKMRALLIDLLDTEGMYLPVCLTDNTYRQGDLYFRYQYTGDMVRDVFPREHKKISEFLERYSQYEALREYGNNFLVTNYPGMFSNRHWATDVSYLHKTGEHYFSGVVRHPEHSPVKLDGVACAAEPLGKHWFSVHKSFSLRSFSVPHGTRGGGSD